MLTMGFDIGEEFNKIVAQGERDLQKEVDKLPLEAQKAAQQEVQKQLASFGPAPVNAVVTPTTPMFALPANMQKYLPYIIIGGGVLLAVFLLSGSSSSKSDK